MRHERLEELRRLTCIGGMSCNIVEELVLEIDQIQAALVQSLEDATQFGAGARIAALEAENKRLREIVDKLRWNSALMEWLNMNTDGLDAELEAAAQAAKESK